MSFTNADRRQLKRLLAKKEDMLHTLQHRRDRRMELLDKRAPAEWLNRISAEINEDIHGLERLEIKIGELLDKQYAAGGDQDAVE